MAESRSSDDNHSKKKGSANVELLEWKIRLLRNEVAILKKTKRNVLSSTCLKVGHLEQKLGEQTKIIGKQEGEIAYQHVLLLDKNDEISSIREELKKALDEIAMTHTQGETCNDEALKKQYDEMEQTVILLMQNLDESAHFIQEQKVKIGNLVEKQDQMMNIQMQQSGVLEKILEKLEIAEQKTPNDTPKVDNMSDEA